MSSCVNCALSKLLSVKYKEIYKICNFCSRKLPTSVMGVTGRVVEPRDEITTALYYIHDDQTDSSHYSRTHGPSPPSGRSLGGYNPLMTRIMMGLSIGAPIICLVMIIALVVLCLKLKKNRQLSRSVRTLDLRPSSLNSSSSEIEMRPLNTRSPSETSV